MEPECLKRCLRVVSARSERRAPHIRRALIRYPAIGMREDTPIDIIPHDIQVRLGELPGMRFVVARQAHPRVRTLADNPGRETLRNQNGFSELRRPVKQNELS